MLKLSVFGSRQISFLKIFLVYLSIFCFLSPDVCRRKLLKVHLSIDAMSVYFMNAAHLTVLVRSVRNVTVVWLMACCNTMKLNFHNFILIYLFETLQVFCSRSEDVHVV